MEWTAGRPKSHQALQSADVLYREVRFRKKNGPLKHGSSLGQVGHGDHSRAKLQIFDATFVPAPQRCERPMLHNSLVLERRRPRPQHFAAAWRDHRQFRGGRDNHPTKRGT